MHFFNSLSNRSIPAKNGLVSPQIAAHCACDNKFSSIMLLLIKKKQRLLFRLTSNNLLSVAGKREAFQSQKMPQPSAFRYTIQTSSDVYVESFALNVVRQRCNNCNETNTQRRKQALNHKKKCSFGIFQES